MDEVQEDYLKYTANLDPMVIETIKMAERVKIFERFRTLINEKEYLDDQVAASVLGWAYEKLAE